MAVLNFLEKLRPYKSVVRRTRPQKDLPENFSTLTGSVVKENASF